jgi:phage terminase large subunit-like protein
MTDNGDGTKDHRRYRGTPISPVIAALDRDETRSLASQLAEMPEKMREDFLGQLDDDQIYVLYNSWWFWARPNQLAPPLEDDWFIWLCLAGRGWGKTRAGGGWVHERAMQGDERRWIALIAQTPGDARDDMIEGPGGILQNCPPWEKPDYQPSKRRVVWPTGAYATVYSGANPEQVRGFSGDTAWCDELAAWDYPRDSWNNLVFGLREAKVENPRVCITTTPKPITLLKELVADEMTRISSGSSYENIENLSPLYYKAVIEPKEHTTLGQQEIYAHLLDEDPRALWTRAMFNKRLMAPPGKLTSIVIGVDPPGGAKQENAEAGIVVVGRFNCDCNGTMESHGVVLADLSGRMRPAEWGKTAVDAFHQWKANEIVAEINHGGDMVEHTIRTVTGGDYVPVRQVRASRGKDIRAEPVASMYERGEMHHFGSLKDLEDQMCTWVKDETKESPDRLDAAVWGFNKLFPLGGVPIALTFGD